jgi:leucyl aminopeptidase
MEIKVLNIGEYSQNNNTLAILVFEGDNISANLDENTSKLITLLKENNKFTGRYKQVETIKTIVDDKIKNIILLGLGKKEELNNEKLRMVSGMTIKQSKKLKTQKLDLLMPNLEYNIEKYYSAITEGLVLGEYKFDKYKSDKKEESIEDVSLITHENIESVQNGLKEGYILGNSTKLARSLVDEPANFMYPEILAKEAEKIGKEHGFEVEVFDEDKIKDLGMEAFLEVSKGSKHPPKFIVMRYFGDKENEKDIFGLVGKGLTYDSGGYSIKPTSSMLDMKTDMAGAAAVIGTMCAVAENKLNINVVAVVAACENMISDKSYKPGDIINSMGGKTIEILNTDAEGRLTLVDAVHYIIEKENATKIIDIATLTGAALVALGTVSTAVLSNNDDFYLGLEDASKITGEKVWRLPIFDEYKQELKGTLGDLKNTGGRYAGTITAGLFIGEFVQNKPWIHMDIAGTATCSKDEGYLTKGATGVGVRTLYYMAKNMK